MPNTGTQTLTASEDLIFKDPAGCTSYSIKNLSSSAGNAQIHVDTLHDDGEFFEIEPGDEYIFRLNHLGIRRITGKAPSGADILKGVVAKTVPEG